MENGLLKHPHVINMENGHQDASCDVFSMKNDAEMLEQIKQLLMENNNLKETMKQMNQEMKERLEELLKRHNQHLLDLNSENELLRKELNSLREKNATSNQGIPVCSNPEETSESKQLKTQLMRLQAEKADLLGLISELQLKLSGFSEDSFVEIRISEKESGEIIHEEKANKTLPDYDVSYSRTNSVKEEGSGTEPEEVAISRLLRSLREETQKVERLEKELSEHKRLAELKEKTSRFCDKDMQTEQEKQNQSEEIFLLHAFFQISSEVDILKQKVKSLNKELQETNDKLNEAKQLKNSLQEKCILLDKRLQENAVDLEEKQNLRYTIKKLELQVESMESEIKLERNKTEAEKNQLAILQVAYDKLNSEYQETRIRESEKVSKVEFNDLVEKLDACEKALAKKQFEIDEIRQMDAKHKEDIETIGLLRAQESWKSFLDLLFTGP
eukprot:XP_017947827.1 PREDICTED: optineurin isoform X5 [Xenopus tropicalis]